jgi:hypothetical protein
MAVRDASAHVNVRMPGLRSTVLRRPRGSLPGACRYRCAPARTTAPATGTLSQYFMAG